ncbi:hypothetical protein CBR_g565 [Chara braunii]|uniref:Uncharacterized protein n=1 Tax=Chara braunii TaxID=69332 RepID=A0A388KBK8_CHABU|nr:hypothetical protein CBR_g565 [Chara braunii]|eukprot:GBG67430.1 hypothetical protein CBR_g565 [Chara braunii]
MVPTSYWEYCCYYFSSTAYSAVTGQHRSNGWYEARQRLIILENTVAEIKIRHDAEVEKVKSKRDEEEKKKRDDDEKERREQDRKEREEMHRQMMEDMNKKWEKICEKMDEKKGDSRKKEIDRLRSFANNAVASTSSTKATIEGEELIRQLLREQEAMKKKLEESIAAQKRLEILENEMTLMRTMRDEALKEVETWKNEALRPGNKRGCAAVTPTTVARTRNRATPEPTTGLAGIVHRHNLELEALKNLRIVDFNARREKEPENDQLRVTMEEEANARCEQELENERLRTVIADIEAAQRVPCTNLRQRIEEMASTDKGKQKTVTEPLSARAMEKKKFAKEQRKDLGNRKKDGIIEICAKEGLKYVTSKRSVEDIINQRMKTTFSDEGKAVQEVSDDTGGGMAEKEVSAEGDAATS